MSILCLVLLCWFVVVMIIVHALPDVGFVQLLGDINVGHRYMAGAENHVLAVFRWRILRY